MDKIWKVLPDPPEEFYKQFPELPKVVAQLLYHRNIKTQKKIDEFLNPDYSQDVHDPYLFKDMKKAVDRILKAVKKQEKITIHGDYDADGVSASVILESTLNSLGLENVEVFLPHRETDGYGLNENTINILSKNGTNLLITCDCGISNKQEIELAIKKGMDVIITDHHDVPEEIPPAHAIIHPKIKDEKYPDKNLAGGAVAFKLAQGLLQKHGQTNSKLANGEEHEAFEKWLLDMVALASVADMVPLVGESRTLTKYGLIVLNKTKRLGLQKLLLEARLLNEDGSKKYELDADKIAFQIAPRINAAGRMNHANVAYKLLMTEKGTDAIDLAYELDQNNKERQKLTDLLVKEAIKQIEKNQKNNPILFVTGHGWSTGIVGLIASKIKEMYYKPTLVMAVNDGEITGSGRSIEGFNLIEAMQEMPDFFKKFGGHPMACGFTLKEDPDSFRQALINKYNEKCKGKTLLPILSIDTEINLDDVNWDLYDVLDKFKPFGKDNEKPKYLARGLTITSFEPVGKDGKHMRIMVKHNSAKVRKTIGWRLCDDNSDGPNWCKELKAGDKIDMVFEIDVNEWNGNRELQLTIVDIKKSEII
ncbi:MAG: single-stranded-DNA-specific exonuclease RecJ [Candidatus Magasanikbacteria bacterium]|nr:single-stranded-DNA-specific exonuclease RecJ [Candidatus Magasanikbacteria bacterium]